MIKEQKVISDSLNENFPGGETSVPLPFGTSLIAPMLLSIMHRGESGCVHIFGMAYKGM